MTINPPTCPECNEPLAKVYERRYDDFQFNTETGTYDEDGLGELEIFCSKCHVPLRDTFPNGVCNYSKKS